MRNQTKLPWKALFSLGAVLITILIVAISIPTVVSARPAAALSWTTQFADEFNGSGALNGANWLYTTGTAYPGGPPNYGTGEIETNTNSTANVNQTGGHLAIIPLCCWTSGRVETQRTDFAAPVGGAMAVEASIQQPNVSGAAAQGYWPAFWLLGEGARIDRWSWPSIGEIDILEDINGQSLVFGTLHCGITPGGPCNETTGIGSGPHACPGCQTGYHTYRIEYDRSVSPEVVRWYLDGQQYHSANSSQVDATTWNNALHHGFHIILNLAMGGGWPGNPTASTASGVPLNIDYVHVLYGTTCAGCPTPTTPPSPTPAPSVPYLGSPVVLPGTIQAEDFDKGGIGVGYNETTAGNQGGYNYRNDGNTDTDFANNCGVCVNYIAPGEWLRYAVSVANAGSYTFNFRHAGGGGGIYHLETTTGVQLTGPITQLATANWDTYVTYSQAVTLPAGNYGIIVKFDSCPACNLNNFDWMSFTGGPIITNTPIGPTLTPTATTGSGGLPAPWLHQDIGAVAAVGSATYSGSTFTVKGSGADIWGAADEFHYVYQTLTGDGTITARVASQTNSNAWAKAGVMFRDTLAAGSMQADMIITPTSGSSFQWRATTGGTSAGANSAGPVAPYWVRLVRSGNNFSAYRSADGAAWTQVGTTTAIAMGSTVYVGLAVTSHADGTLSTVTFDNVSVTGGSGGPTATPTRTNTPVTGPTLTPTRTNTPVSGSDYTQGLTVIDTANVRIWFHSNINSAWADVHYTVNGGAQQNFRMTFNNASGNWEQNVSGLTPGGVLYYYFTYEKAGIAIDTQWFQYIVPTGPTLTPTRTATTVIGPTNTPTATTGSGGLPAPWQHQDIGAVAAVGSATYSGSTFTVKGSGADIWGAADEFHYVYQTLTGDGTITARVASQTNSNAWAKAGVMFRNTLAAGSMQADMIITPTSGSSFQWRATTGGTSAGANSAGPVAPYWVRLVRSGNNFSAYRSADGAAWTQVGTTTAIAMGSTVYVGLAVTSHADGTLSTVTFDNVSVTGGSGGPTPTPIGPSPTPTQGSTSCTVPSIAAPRFPMVFQNNTNGAYANSQIYVMILGMPSNGAGWYYLKPDGTATHINHLDASAPGHLTKNGVNYANMSFSLAQSCYFNIPSAWYGGRAYISVGSPMYIGISPDDQGWAGPDYLNAADPNIDVYFDWYEFTYDFNTSPQVHYGANSTMVDQFGFPITVRLQQTSSGYDQSVGINLTRAQVYSQFTSFVGPAFDPLESTYRILAPRSSRSFWAGGAYANYLQPIIDQTWTYYTNNQFNFTDGGDVYSGRVGGDGRLQFTKNGAGPFFLSKPTTIDVMACAGSLASGAQVEKDMGRDFCAAFNRGVSLNTANWKNASTYYPAGVLRNDYAAFFHPISINNRAYAFAYDDFNDQSSVQILPNGNPPSRVTIGVGW